tara:strand:- start:54 stop:560 length:507 start_codon:yes stop_codon:yes gene_type:complete
MKLFKFIIIIFFILFSNNVKANNVVFIDIDFLIQNSKIGKLILDKIEINNSKNIEILKNKELKIRQKEEDINNKKNIISESEFKKEVALLKKNIDSFNKEKKKIINDFNKFKVEELNLLLDKFNNIINDYMNKNSIQIVLSKKNLYMGKKSSDITNDILLEIDKQLKQ